MNLDEQLYRLPLVGCVIKRLHTYFKNNTLITDLIHVSLGLGVGLVIAGEELFVWGVVALTANFLGHVYAFIKGS